MRSSLYCITFFLICIENVRKVLISHWVRRMCDSDWFFSDCNWSGTDLKRHRHDLKHLIGNNMYHYHLANTNSMSPTSQSPEGNQLVISIAVTLSAHIIIKSLCVNRPCIGMMTNALLNLESLEHLRDLCDRSSIVINFLL